MISGLFNKLQTRVFFLQSRYLHIPNESPKKAFYCLNRTIMIEALTLGSCIKRQCDVDLHCWTLRYGSLKSTKICLAFDLRLRNRCKFHLRQASVLNVFTQEKDSYTLQVIENISFLTIVRKLSFSQTCESTDNLLSQSPLSMSL